MITPVFIPRQLAAVTVIMFVYLLAYLAYLAWMSQQDDDCMMSHDSDIFFFLLVWCPLVHAEDVLHLLQVCVVDLDLKAWELKLYFVAIVKHVRAFIFQSELASPLDYCQSLGKEMLLWIWISKKGFLATILIVSVTIDMRINNHVITM